MGDDSSRSGNFVNDLKKEWKLFWETFADEKSEAVSFAPASGEDKDPFLTGKIQTLELNEIKAITRALSGERKKLNQKLESLKKEIDLNNAKLEALKLVGGDQEDTLHNIDELNEIGHLVSSQLDRINDRLKQARQREDEIKFDLQK